MHEISLEFGGMIAPIVVHEHNICNSGSSDELRDENKSQNGQLRRQAEIRIKEDKSPVKKDTHLFVSGYLIPRGTLVRKYEKNGLQHPNDFQRNSPREEVFVLIRNQAGGTGNGWNAGKIFLIPHKKREIVNIRIRIQYVSDGMVGIVSFLPPVNGVSAANASAQLSHKIVNSSVFKNLLVAIVMT